MDDVTSRQQRILDFIRTTVRERGYPPTVREIGEAVGLTSSSSVHAQLENLRRKGYLRKDPTKPRAIEVAGARAAQAVTVPLVGRVAAGAPVLAEESVEDFLSLPPAYAGENHFALTVSGDSMRDVGIFDRDVVVVRRQDTATDGTIVAALVPGPAEPEATIKRLARSERGWTLEPANPAHRSIPMPEDGRILGVVVSLLRRI